MSVKAKAFILGIGVAALAGCATSTDTVSTSSSSSSDSSMIEMKNSEISRISSELDRTERELANTLAELERAQQASASTTTTMPAMGGGDGSLFPPNPKPGECYARVLIPAVYNTTTETVLKREASERVEIIPATFGPADETILVKEASTKLVVEPAVYEEVTETVLVKEASQRLVEVPAKYDTVTERILDKPAHTVWKQGSSALGAGAPGVLQTSVDQSTGEIMCLVEVPATYKTVNKTVLVSPPRTETIDIPAEYKTITKRVLAKPATTREIVVPAEYQTVTRTVMTQPPSERRIPIPAEYETVTKREKVTDELLEWREVLCDVNLTNSTVRQLQSSLSDKGYYNGPIDGIIGVMTLGASNAYAKAKGLALGNNYIPMEVAESLGINF